MKNRFEHAFLILRNLKLSLFFIFSLSLTFLSCGSSNKQGEYRPNIILIMADDMGYSDLGCYGSEISTPNIDKLAEGGIRFTQFYNASRCCPTRASLLTGLYSHQAGMGAMVDRRGDREKGAYQGYLNENCVTIAEVLKTSGYNTLMSGKWHVGEKRPNWPTERGFDRYFGLISGAANYFNIEKTKNPKYKRQMAIDGEEYHPPKENFYMTDAITDHAVELIDEYAKKNNPFFLYVAYTAPHYPLHALPEDIAKYRGKYFKGWEKLREERFQKMLELGVIDPNTKLSPLDSEVPDWETVEDKDLMDLKMAVYAAQIDRMDQGIGRILDELRGSGKMKNTLVLFLSDNGGCQETGAFGQDWRNNNIPPGGEDSYQSYGRSWANASNTPFRMFKQWEHEGGIATPLIAYWPEQIQNAGSVNSEFVGHVIDFLPTFADLAGAEYPKEYRGETITPSEGISFEKVLRGENIVERDKPLFWEHLGNKAVRRGDWKLVSKKSGNWELYNIKADRAELTDLSKSKPELVKELKALWRKWSIKVGVR